MAPETNEATAGLVNTNDGYHDSAKVVITSNAGDDGKEEPGIPLKAVLGRLFREVPGIKPLFACGVICALTVGGAWALWAFLFGKMMKLLDRSDVGDRANEILYYFYILGILGFGLGAFFYFNLFIRISAKISIHLRKQYYDALLNMEMSFFDQESSGALASKLISEVKVIEVGLGAQFGISFEKIGMFINGFIVAFTQGYVYALILLALTPVVGIAGAIGGKIISEMSKEGSDIYNEASGRSAEVLSNFDTILSLNAGKSEAARYEALIKGVKFRVKKKALRVGAAMGGMQFAMYGLFYGFGMYIGAYLVGEGKMKVDEVFAVFFGVLIAGMGVGQFATTLPDVTGALVACQNLFKSIDRVPRFRQPDDGKKGIQMVIEVSIKFENLSFSYPTRPDTKVLKNITLEIKRGEIVAFVGPSGCGKSTMIALLERFYEPTDGAILVDGVQIWNLDRTYWRGQLGYVGQEPVLFNGTIAENILLGTSQTGKDYSHEDVEFAARQANAHNFIEEFPEGYKTNVGEGGGQLSGGQKQRIAIARALVRNPQILLLDEATSALDTESEKIVQEALDKILAQGKRTCIVIAHRLSTVVNADKIVVFQDGEIVQMGRFDVLSKDTDGVFHSMLMAQDVLGADALKPKQMEFQKSWGTQRSATTGTARSATTSLRALGL